MKHYPQTAPLCRPAVGRARLLAVFFCGVFLLLLTGCGMKTNLKMNSDFTGERVIVCDEISDTNLLFSSAKVKDITGVLEANCPEQLAFSYQYTDSKQSKAVYTFTLKFSSQEDYKAKVAALIGRTPSVAYTYQSPEEQLFKSGFSLTEDFESKDLLVWVKPTLKKELNLSRDLSALTDTVTVTLNDVTYDNENLMSSRIKINTIAQYRLSSLDVTTIRYGDDDYEREVVLNMPTKTVETLGKENIQRFVQDAVADGASGQWLSSEGSTAHYRLFFSGTVEQLDDCTRKLFGGGSALSYTKDESLYTAFSETAVLSETLDFSRFPCEADGSCNVSVTYKNMDACEFDPERSTLSAASNKVNGEGLSDENKTVRLIYKKSTGGEVRLYSSTVYRLSEVDVVTEISGDDKVRQSLILASPVETKDYGAQFAASYFRRQLEGSDFTVTVGQFNGSGTQFAVTISTPKTDVERVNALLAQYFGEGNAVKIDGKDKFTFYNKRSVAVDVDIADVIKPSQYTGEIMYSFKGFGQAYDVDWTSASGGRNDVLMGAYRSESFEHPISSHTFRITYHLRRVNLMFVLLIAALAVVICGLILMISGGMMMKRRRQKEAEKLAAVKTMALVKLPDGTETMMEVTPEEAAQTVVLAPRNDDGLDDDDDEPENIWLFSTSLRLFSVMACVLFFLSFATIAWSGIDLKTLGKTSASITGLHLVMGLDLMDRTLEGFYLNAILLAIPVVIFLLLSFRATLPKMISDVSIIGLSAIQIWYLISLPNSLEEQVNAFAAEVSKRMTMEMAWGYNYSIMIYILLLLGGVILLLLDTGLAIRRQHRDD